MKPRIGPHTAKAQARWGLPLPDWIEALAALADRDGLKGAAKAADVSVATVSYLIANKYGARLDKVRRQVRLALDLGTVECPVLGTIKASACVAHQERGVSTLNMIHVRLSRTCPTCRHKYPSQGEGHVKA